VVVWDATDAVTGQPSIAVGGRLTDAGAVKGAAVVFAALPVVAPAMVGALGGPEHPSFTIINRSTHAVVSASETAKPTTGGRPAASFPQTKPSGEWVGLDGTARYFASSDIKGSPWRVYAGIRRSTVLAASRGTLLRESLAGIAALLLLALAAWVLNRRVARPLRRLTAGVVRAGLEPDGVRVPEAGTAEVIALAHEFNKMLDVRAGHEAQLVHQATHHPLTGLPNKILLADRMSHALHRDRDSTSVAVVFLGIARLDTVSNALGRAAADEVLVEVARRLSAVLRPGDTAAHFNDDEFVILCEGTVSADIARIADRVHQYVQEPFQIGAADVRLHASIGISMATDSATSSEQLLREAAMAMNEAKTTNRAWVLFDEAAHAHAAHHLQIERDLSQALSRHELVVYYQPVLNIETGRVVGAEALVRWQHPERGLVPPMEFIPIAEQTGQIIPIGRYVLTEACQQTAVWAAGGRPLRISVNVSVDQLRQPQFLGVVQEVLAQTRLPAGQLCLEITESTLIREAGPGWNSAMELRRMGVQLSIDDFGTGYSSLAYLHQLPVDELKIDRSFINQLDRDPRDRHLVEAINAMARALNLIVVAEGVETAAQLEMLAEIGCGNAQGYLIARPQTADQFLKFLETRSESASAGRQSH
jgi:diguanylate cyclase (GGDEF)-like protein